MGWGGGASAPAIDVAVLDADGRLAFERLEIDEGARGEDVGLRCVVGAREYILGCDNAQSVINDVVCGVLAELVPNYPAADVLRGDRFPKEFRRAALPFFQPIESNYHEPLLATTFEVAANMGGSLGSSINISTMPGRSSPPTWARG